MVEEFNMERTVEWEHIYIQYLDALLKCTS